VVLHHLRAVWWSVSRATRQTVRVAVEPNIGLLLKWRFQMRRQDRTAVKRDLEVWLGEPYPLGATLTEEGVNFALYSEDATAVELWRCMLAAKRRSCVTISGRTEGRLRRASGICRA
jgi:hypothetical protein